MTHSEKFTKAFDSAFQEVIDKQYPLTIARSNERPVVGSYVGYPGINNRLGFDRTDYSDGKKDEYKPRNHKEAIAACLEAYDANPLVKNTIDMMTDLVVQGVDIVARTNQKFWKKWFHKVIKGPQLCERIASTTFRAGTSVIKRRNVRLDTPRRPEIPGKYKILNPLAVDIDFDVSRAFIDSEDIDFYLNVPQNFQGNLLADNWRYDDPRSNPETGLPRIQPLDPKQRVIKLNRKELAIVAYKKDDWDVWGNPLCLSILDDLHLFHKMRLADLSALDGAVSKIRLWKLGSLDHEIIPAPSVFLRLQEALKRFVPGGVTDIIWNPAIDFKESSSDSHFFLGEEKYVVPIKNILFGLGLPNVLHGFGKVTGASNNIMEMRIMMHRLRYMRQLIIDFFVEEIELVRNAMGYRDNATLVFDVDLLNDEAQIYQALLGAVDRNLLSHELVQERLGAVPEVENVRIIREEKRRESGKMPPKASQWHNPMLEKQLQQTMLTTLFQQGQLPDEAVKDITGYDANVKPPKPDTGPSNVGENNGRPPGAKDKEKRKTRVLKASSTTPEEYAARWMWADETMNLIMRDLQDMNLEYDDRALQIYAFKVLCSMPYQAKYNKDVLAAAVEADMPIPEEYRNLIQSTKVDDSKIFRSAYALLALE